MILNIAKGCRGEGGKIVETYTVPEFVLSEKTFHGIRLFSHTGFDNEGKDIYLISERSTGFAIPGSEAKTASSAWTRAKKTILKHGVYKTKAIIAKVRKEHGVANK